MAFDLPRTIPRLARFLRRFKPFIHFIMFGMALLPHDETRELCRIVSRIAPEWKHRRNEADELFCRVLLTFRNFIIRNDGND
jgi:hypothetical protein